MAENPCEGMKIEASVREEPVRILSIEEIKKLLTLAQKKIEAPMKVGKTKVSIIRLAT